MFALIVTTGPTKGQAIELTEGQSLVLGRASDCHIRFDDKEVSARHVEVTWGQEGFSILDLGTSNGTYVNGVRLSARVGLRVGDFIQLGQVLLQLKHFEVAVAALKPDLGAGGAGGLALNMLSRDVAKTQVWKRSMVLNPSTRTPTEFSLGERPTAMFSGGAHVPISSEAVTSAAELARLISSPDNADVRLLVQREDQVDRFKTIPVTIGRERGSGISLDDDAVSLRHAVIDHRLGEYVIRDVGSSNGTFLNGRRIVEQVLEDGDVISLGRYALLVVRGAHCLGLALRAPDLAGNTLEMAKVSQRIGIIQAPLAEAQLTGQETGKRKKKAAELVWYATSDLDRGVFRARSALIGLVLGTSLTVWMLAQGDSKTLAGRTLSAPHESSAFVELAGDRDRSRCTACHTGVGRVSTLRCFDCHLHNRPNEAHADASVECAGCHQEHKGARFRSSASARLGCTGCHVSPHEKLARIRPELVLGFRFDAPADVEFHVRHQSEAVRCLTCHAEEVSTASRGTRGACGQCHAPDGVTREDCQRCHKEHPDRELASGVGASAGVGTNVALIPPEDPPRFAVEAVPWALALIVFSFVLASLIPRRRQVVIEPLGSARREG